MAPRNSCTCRTCRQRLPIASFDTSGYSPDGAVRFYPNCRDCRAVILSKRLIHVPPNPSGRCMCGCGRLTTIAKATCRRHHTVEGHPKRFINGHKPKTDEPLYVVDVLSGCWNWAKSKNRAGYGSYANQFAHRWMYEQVNGPIPEGLQLDHLCRNPSCVNPGHLEAVTPTENLRRSRHTKLTANDVRDILMRSFSHQTDLALATEYGVHRRTINAIRKREIWKDIVAPMEV